MSDERVHLPPERRNLSTASQDFARWSHMAARDDVAFALQRAADRWSALGPGAPGLDCGTEIDSLFSETRAGRGRSVVLGIEASGALAFPAVGPTTIGAAAVGPAAVGPAAVGAPGRSARARSCGTVADPSGATPGPIAPVPDVAREVSWWK